MHQLYKVTTSTESRTGVCSCEKLCGCTCLANTKHSLSKAHCKKKKHSGISFSLSAFVDGWFQLKVIHLNVVGAHLVCSWLSTKSSRWVMKEEEPLCAPQNYGNCSSIKSDRAYRRMQPLSIGSDDRTGWLSVYLNDTKRGMTGSMSGWESSPCCCGNTNGFTL